MLTPEEEMELLELEKGMPVSAPNNAAPVKPIRNISDISYPNMTALTLEEESELAMLENEFGQRPQLQPEEKGLVTQIGEFVDSYTGAPVRRAVGTFQDTGSLSQTGSAFLDQFGNDPSIAPTGKEIAEKAGFNSENTMIPRNPLAVEDEKRAFNRENVPTQSQVVSPAGMVGLGADIALDITNILPFAGPLLKYGAQGTGKFLKGSAKAADFALGTPLVRVGEVATDTAKASHEATKSARVSLSKLFKPDIAPDFNELSEIAAKNNIPKELLNESIEFGNNSIISRHARNTAEGPLGNLEKHEKLVQAVSGATEDTIARIGKTKSIADDVEAGGIIRSSFDEGVDSFFNGMAETYGNAIKLAPDISLDKKSSRIISKDLDGLEMWAKKRLGFSKDAEKVLNNPLASRKEVTKATNETLDVLSSTNEAITGTQKSQAEEVLKAVQIVKSAILRSGGDLGQVYSAMRDIGDIAFKSKNYLAQTPSDVRKFQEIYFSLQKGMTESIRSKLGNDFANALVDNNKQMSNFFSQRGKISNIIGNKNLSDETVFQTLIMKGDSGKLDALFSIISPEARDQLKASFLKKTLVRNADEIINFGASRKRLNELKASGKLKSLYSVDELQQIDDVLKLGDRAGIGVLSTSGTGASGMFKNITGTLKDKIAGDALIDNLKRGARKNYVEVPVKSINGTEYIQKIKAPESSKPKSGFTRLREASPVTKKQFAQGAKAEANNQRNERLEKFKQSRGIR